jgi:glycosyltransferase involved in cell wall biosynthesis
MLRLLMLASYFPRPGNRALGNWALSQAQAFQRQGIDVRVVSINPWIPKFLSKNGAASYAECPPFVSWDGLPAYYPRCLWYPVRPFKQYEFKAPKFPMALAWRTAGDYLQRTVSEFKPDVLYAHHTAVNGYLAERLHQCFKIPYLITDHDFTEIAACADLPKRKAHFDKVIRSCSRMIAVAHRMEAEMVSIFPQAKTCTIWNGTDPIPEAIRTQPRPADLAGKVVLFSCGAFYRRKGFPLLIKAFAKVAGRFPEAVLRIAGDGEDRTAVHAAIRENNLSDRVHLLGFQAHDKVLTEMSWCDAFALVGWDEPFATVFTEALSAGKPVVSASDGGITDVVRQNEHGLLVEPKSVESAAAALAELLADSRLRAQLGANAKMLFERGLKWDHNALRMKALFEEAAGTRS